MRTLAVTLLLVVAGLAALATPSTLVTIPSTDIQPTGVWHLGFDTVVPLDGDEATPFVDLGLTYGITDRIEAGIDLISPADNPVWLNAKVLLVTPDQFAVPVAAGIYNYSTADALNQQVMYVVGSYTFPVLENGLRLTAGAWQGEEEALGPDDSGIMLGLDTTMGKWWYGADYVSGDSGLGSVNVGVGYALTDSIGIIIGYDNFNATGVKDAVNFQLDVNF